MRHSRTLIQNSIVIRRSTYPHTLDYVDSLNTSGYRPSQNEFPSVLSFLLSYTLVPPLFSIQNIHYIHSVYVFVCVCVITFENIEEGYSAYRGIT